MHGVERAGAWRGLLFWKQELPFSITLGGKATGERTGRSGKVGVHPPDRPTSGTESRERRKTGESAYFPVRLPGVGRFTVEYQKFFSKEEAEEERKVGKDA